jgi:hypothetical protein
MAVIEINNPSSLKVKLDLGMVDGKTKTRNKSYSLLKYDASAQDCFDVGTAIMGLQTYPVMYIKLSFNERKTYI